MSPMRNVRRVRVQSVRMKSDCVSREASLAFMEKPISLSKRLNRTVHLVFPHIPATVQHLTM